MRVAEFEKVSFEQFHDDSRAKIAYCIPDYEKMTNAEIEEAIQKAYDKVKLPERATAGSAGYDFVSPYAITLRPKQSAYIPSGIRVKFTEPDWALLMYPRSSYGINFRMQLDNTVGVIDSDYYYAENEGHIMIKITNDTVISTDLNIYDGVRFVQGIFTPYGITTTDNATETRTGGIGSTGT